MNSRRKSCAPGMRPLWTAILLLGGNAIVPAQNVTIKEYPLSGNPNPQSITAGPDGALWFTEYFANRIGRITTAGVVTEYPVTMNSGYLSQLNGITAGPDGALWFTKSYESKIGRITAAGSVTEYATLEPYTWPGSMVVGPDGALWFTMLGGKVGRITTSGIISDVSFPDDGIPLYITTGPDGALWFTGRTKSEGADPAPMFVGRMNMDGTVTEYPLGRPTCLCAYPGQIAAGPDGALWYAQDTAKIGRITTNGIRSEYRLAPNRWPGWVTKGPDGAMWFTENGGSSYEDAVIGRIGRISMDGLITEYPIPTDHPYPGGLALGPDGALWFTEQLGAKIGQVVITPSNNTLPCLDLCVTNYQSLGTSPAGFGKVYASYIADLSNPGQAMASVTAVLTSLDPFNIRVLPALDVLTFAPVPAKSQIPSTNRFSIMVDPSVPVDLTKLHWTFQSVAAAPVANPGPNRTVNAGTLVALDGSGSTNPSGGELTFDWVFVSRPPGTATRLFYTTTLAPKFLADVPGTYVISLTVRNGVASSTANVTITVIP